MFSSGKVEIMKIKQLFLRKLLPQKLNDLKVKQENNFLYVFGITQVSSETFLF